jgi:hypothetical protein
MALSKRAFPGKGSAEERVLDNYDEKLRKPGGGDVASRKRRWCASILGSVAVVALFFHHVSIEENTETLVDNQIDIRTTENADPTNAVPSQLYPFLSSNGNRKVPFPIIPYLENCTVSFQAPAVRKDESQWRKPFWIPSFPSSGASNPTNKGDLSKDLIGQLTGLANNKPVKNYHMSMKKRLKRCHGVSETVACTQGHPITPIQPETQTQNFQPRAIVFVRNFATAFPASVTDKNIAYHNAKTQNTVPEYRKLRDEWMEPTFTSWARLLDWWRTSEAYDVAMYVPFEDLMTTNREAARTILQQLATTLKEGGFETASSNEDLDCIWYTTIREEWTRQQAIMDYIPMYTSAQKEWMEVQLQQYIQLISSSSQNGGDASLITLLNRYLGDVKSHLLLEQR